MSQEQQQQPGPPPPPPAAQEQDGLHRIWQEIRKDRDRLRRLGEVSTKKILMELSDTVLSYVEDLAGYFLQFRNWSVESLGDVDSRIAALEEDIPEPLLDEEEEAMIVQLSARCEALARTMLETPGISAAARKELEDTLALCKRTNEWVASASEAADDEGGDADEDDGDEPEEAINASGGSGAS